MHAFDLNRRTILLGVAVAGLTAHGFVTAQTVRKIDVWKDPSCGCCKDWVAHLEKNGFKATIYETGNNAKRAELGLADAKWSDDDLLNFMVQHPILMNRPVVVTPLGARLCRPSEAVLDILPNAQLAAFNKEDGEAVVNDKGQRV